jgi:ankyrin repeat protein
MVEMLLSRSDVDPDEEDISSQTPLYFAAQIGHEDIVRLLHVHGANVGTRDVHGRTPIWRAADNVHTATVSLLIENGADIDSRYEFAIAPIAEAEIPGQKEASRLLLASVLEMRLLELEGSFFF